MKFNPHSLSLIYKADLQEGFNTVDYLAEVNGYSRLDAFNAAYVIYWNLNEIGNKIYSAEKRR